MRSKTVLIASPRGFCAGVERAVKTVEDTLEIFGSPIYVKHEIVHNKHVVTALEGKGALMVEDMDSIPDGSVVVFSAHGSPRAHYEEAKRRNLRVIDATCPLVTKVHLELLRYLKEGYRVVYIGHKGHVEGMGVLGEAPLEDIPLIETLEDVNHLDIGPDEKLVYLTQTTLSVDETRGIVAALREKYPNITAPPLEDICFATTNRQKAVKALAERSGLVLIFGSQNSSNSKRLMETARSAGAEAYLIDDISMFQARWFENVMTIGISAGASAPEHVVVEAVEYFRARGYTIGNLNVLDENMHFSPPLEIIQMKAKKASGITATR